MSRLHGPPHRSKFVARTTGETPLAPRKRVDRNQVVRPIL